MRGVRTRVGAAVFGAALVLTMAGCGDDGGEASDATSTESSSAGSSPTYGEDHIMAQVKKVNTSLQSLGPSEKIPTDADWATDSFRKSYDATRDGYTEHGAEVKGKVTSTALHLDESDPEAPGGWDVSVYNCAESTLRLYVDGEDITPDPDSPGQILPKGPQTEIYLQSFATPDGGKSWQLDDSQLVEGTQAEESPCAA